MSNPSLPKKELTTKESIAEAVQNFHDALLENLEASRLEVAAKSRKKKAYDKLIAAKEHLRAVENDVSNNWSIF